MPTLRSFISRHFLAFTAALVAQVVIAGCVTTHAKSAAVYARMAVAPTASADSATMATLTGIHTHPMIPVVRYGRYTLVELIPSAEQQDLMDEVVDVTIPPTFSATVGDALRYVLLRSGFALCDSPTIHILNTLPLPAADFHLGPLTLERALRLLAGPAWKLEVNPLTREVCFAPTAASSPAGMPGGFPPKSPDSPSRAGGIKGIAHEGSS